MDSLQNRSCLVPLLCEINSYARKLLDDQTIGQSSKHCSRAAADVSKGRLLEDSLKRSGSAEASSIKN